MNLASPLKTTAGDAHPALDEKRHEDAAGVLVDFVLHQAEEDERRLSYHTDCKSERARKISGSYYTPVDVAEFFWNQFFEGLSIRTAADASGFINQYTLVEPSAGSGVLIFALIQKLMSLGVPVRDLRAMDLWVVDINDAALAYIRRQIKTLNDGLGAQIIYANFVRADFRTWPTSVLARPAVFFGNPPFVANPPSSAWKNIYADFLAKCLDQGEKCAAVHFILPLSIAFSRYYIGLREHLRQENFKVVTSHFDNIPDTLFKSGKPQSTNTNKANSQRCTILSAYASKEHSLHSTCLHRWSAAERSKLLASSAKYQDVTHYKLDNQFLRPATPEIAAYLQSESFAYRLDDLTDEAGKHQVHVASVARNFIPVRSAGGGGINSFDFENKYDLLRFLGIVASDVFLDYWRSIGDGFHVTKSNVTAFPVSRCIDHAVRSNLPVIDALWRRRRSFEKTKLNSGCLVTSYDFNGAMPSLNAVLRDAGLGQGRGRRKKG